MPGFVYKSISTPVAKTNTIYTVYICVRVCACMCECVCKGGLDLRHFPILKNFACVGYSSQLLTQTEFDSFEVWNMYASNFQCVCEVRFARSEV